MEYTKLGGDLRISRIGFGCEPLGGTDWGNVDKEQATAAVHKALDLGINFFDTADVYGLGLSETLLSEALAAKRHEVVIVTKFGVDWQCRPNGLRARTFIDASPRRAIVALENSLRRLRLDRISLYLIHWPDPKTPIADTMQALIRCQEAGKIKYIGVSNFAVDLIREANQVASLTAVELQYNAIDLRFEADILPFCREHGIGTLAYGTLAQGLLTGKYGLDCHFDQDDRRHRLPHFEKKALGENLRVVDRLREVGRFYGKSPAQVAIRWVLENVAVSCAIVGAKSPAQVEANVEAVRWSMTPEERRYIAKLPSFALRKKKQLRTIIHD